MNLELGRITRTLFAQIDLKDATIKIKDGSSDILGEGNELTIKVGDGNLTYDETRNVIYQLNKGALDEVRLGDEAPMDVSFGFVWQYVQPGAGCSGNGIVTPENALKKTGPCVGWTSTDADTCRPYAVDIIVVLQNAVCASRKQTLTFPDFRWEKLSHDAKSAMISCSGKCNTTGVTIDHD